MSSCCNCIEVPTIQSVYDSETAEYTPGTPVNRDLVHEALAVTDGAYGSYETAVHDRIWQDYRYRMIAGCDEDTWVQVLGDRLAAEAYSAVAVMDAATNAATTVTNPADTRTIVHGSRTDTLGRTREDLPDNFTSDYTYPTERGEDSNQYGSQTDTETTNRSVARQLRELMEDIKDPLDDLMRAIAGCWLNRW